MSRLRLLLAACLLAPSAGCESFRKWIGREPQPPGPGHTGALPQVSAEQLVGYLNGQAGRLKNITYSDVTVSLKEGEGLGSRTKSMFYPTLRGSLSASQPRNFRMVTQTGLVDAKVDFGSNPQQFWVYFNAPTMQPTYVFASHSDFQEGKAKLPGNMPFDPEWVLQALGMTTFPEDAQYEPVKPDERARTYTLSWASRMPNGMQVRREVVFAADDADPRYNQAQVRKHVIRDMKGNVICAAEVKSATTVSAGGADPATGRPYVVQYPTHIVLRWEEQKSEMTLKLGGAKFNQELSPQDMHRLFDMPNKEIRPENLAHARYDSRER
jgi:hypothetical protein